MVSAAAATGNTISVLRPTIDNIRARMTQLNAIVYVNATPHIDCYESVIIIIINCLDTELIYINEIRGRVG